jgi:hypothetical protein
MKFVDTQQFGSKTESVSGLYLTQLVKWLTIRLKTHLHCCLSLERRELVVLINADINRNPLSMCIVQCPAVLNSTLNKCTLFQQNRYVKYEAKFYESLNPMLPSVELHLARIQRVHGQCEVLQERW